MAEGVPDDLYWRSTASELMAILEHTSRRREQQERAAAHRAGLIAAMIGNVHRKKGARRLKPSDFVREPTRVVSPETARQILDGWAARQNRGEPCRN